VYVFEVWRCGTSGAAIVHDSFFVCFAMLL
jgi:hypothetical protein